MAEILFVRHGRTEWNAGKRLQGHTDIPLSEEGRDLLTDTGLPDRFQSFVIVSSPLVRAVETAQLVTGREPVIEPQLIEMNWGEWEGRTVADLRAELGSAMTDNENRGLDIRPDGGESPREVMTRLEAWFSSLDQNGWYVAFTHKGVIRAALCLGTAWNMMGKPPIRLDWTAGHLFSLAANGRLTLTEANIPLNKGT